MANQIRIKRSAVPSKVPTVSDLALGELAINTHDGKLYLKKDTGSASIVEVGAPGIVESVLLQQAVIRSYEYVCPNTNPDQTVLTVDTGVYSTLKFVIQAKFDGNLMSTEWLCICNATEAISTQYATLSTGTVFCTFSTSVSAGVLSLLVTPTDSGTTIKVVAQLISY